MNKNDLIVGTVLSLTEAISEAGGSVSADKLKAMSLMEFITDIAANNHIRFVFVPPGRGGETAYENLNSRSPMPGNIPLPINKSRSVVICRYSKNDNSKIYLRVTNGDSMGWVEEKDKHLATSFMNSQDASSIYMELLRLAGKDARAMDAMYGVAYIEPMTASRTPADKGE